MAEDFQKQLEQLNMDTRAFQTLEEEIKKVIQELSEDAIDLRTIFYNFDTFEDAKKRLEEIKLEIRRKVDDSL